MDNETSYFAEYVKAFNSQHFYGRIFQVTKDYLLLKQHKSPEYYFKYYSNKYYYKELPTEEDIQLLQDYLEELKIDSKYLSYKSESI